MIDDDKEQFEGLMSWNSPVILNYIKSKDSKPWFLEGRLDEERTTWNLKTDEETGKNYYNVYYYPLSVKRPLFRTLMINPFEIVKRRIARKKFQARLNTCIKVKVYEECCWRHPVGTFDPNYEVIILLPPVFSEEWNSISDNPLIKSYKHVQVEMQKMAWAFDHVMQLLVQTKKLSSEVNADEFRKKYVEDAAEAIRTLEQARTSKMTNTSGDDK